MPTVRIPGQRSGVQRGSQPFPRDLQSFREHTGFTDDSHEIRIANPAWENVQMNVASDPGPGRFPQVHSEIDAVRTIKTAENVFQPLGKKDHFLCGVAG